MSESKIALDADECAASMLEMVLDTPLQPHTQVIGLFQLGIWGSLTKVHAIREEIQCFKALTVALSMRYAFGETAWHAIQDRYMDALVNEKRRHSTYTVFVRIVDNYPKYLQIVNRIFDSLESPPPWDRFSTENVYELLAAQFANNCNIKKPTALSDFLKECLSVVPEVSQQLRDNYDITSSYGM